MELVFTTFALFLVTIVASYIFYQRIKMAQSEYDESKDTVRNITFGFTRQVKRMESELGKIERETLQAKYMASEALSAKQGNSDEALAGLEKVKELSDRVNGIEESIETMKKDLSKIASQPRVVIPANPVDAPIPVQGDDILQGLTETELDVLKRIVDFGEGTVPEIKEHIDKTREHTARLLKKLYDKGFIDRNTNSMPYRYSIRKEIRDLILEQKEFSTIGL
ncbi:MarR family transcriptional regulator [Candidatus Bathyarchaeota archaeon]|nr:MAG: MarR family transcriptional regulator [Candidatus Bathyarchaeota archaeon]